MGNLTRQQINGTDVEDFLMVAWKHSLQFESPKIDSFDLFERLLDRLNLEQCGVYSAILGSEVLPGLFAEMDGVVIAREFSECLYAFVPMWTGKGADKRPLTDAERRDIAERWMELMKSCGADELHFLAHQPGFVPVEDAWEPGSEWLGGVPYRLRAWWD